jgi:hypothetical protein
MMNRWTLSSNKLLKSGIGYRDQNTGAWLRRLLIGCIALLAYRVAQASGGKSFIDFKVDPTKPSVVYTYGSPPGVLVKTTDGGETWEHATEDRLIRMTGLMIASAAPVVLYARSSRSLLKSTDQGSTWIETGTFPPFPDFLALDSASSSTLYAGSFGGNPPTDKPWIRSFSFDGKKLIVSGEYFDAGAVILLDGQEQGTKNDPRLPDSRLIGKKTGKKIKKHPETKIQVRNASGNLSQEVTIWPPLD